VTADKRLPVTKETKYDFELVRVDLMKQRDSHKKPTIDETVQHLIDQYNHSEDR